MFEAGIFLRATSASKDGAVIPRPERDSQVSAEPSAGLGEVVALLARLCLLSCLGATETLLEALPPRLLAVLWLTIDSGRVDLRGTGAARVTVWRWDGWEVFLAASLGVTGVRLAREGAWGCWREEGAVGVERS